MLRWVLLLPLIVVLVLFGLSNRQPVSLKLWPFDLAWDVPLSAAVLIIAAVAFLVGAVIAWAAGLQHRSRARRLEDANRGLEAELAQLRARQVQQEGAPVVPPLRPALPRPAA